jgi:large subunit ribosomal protein L15
MAEKEPKEEAQAEAKAPARKKAEPKAPAAKPAAAKAAAKPAKTAAAKTAGAASAKPAPKAAKAAEGDVAARPLKPRVLKVHHLRPAPGAKKARMRVGRGEASKGKTAGRGTKGTKARSTVPARLEGGQMPLHMRLPKLRGFRNHFRVEYQVVNLGRLSELYPQGGDVTPADLIARRVVRAGYPIKILGEGELTVKLSVTADAFSASAKDKILAAGGSVSE